MKKFIIHTALALLFITFITACSSARRNASAAPVPCPSESLNIDLGWFYQKNLAPITFNEADSIYDNYRDKFKQKMEKNVLRRSNKFPKRRNQSKYIWISFDRLKTYVDALAEYETKISPADKNAGTTVSGVRIYFGAYPKNYQTDSVRRKLTAIFCGTVKCKDAKGRIVHRDIAVKGKNQIFAITDYENHGHLCPPDICPGALLDEQ